MSINKVSLGLEAIAVQSGVLKHELTVIISGLRKKRKFKSKDFKNTDFTKVVKKHTGMDIGLNPCPGSNAYTYIPAIDKNHVLTRFWGGHDELEKDSKALLKKAKELEGMVDRKRGKVSGVFSEIRTEVHLGIGLMKSPKFTDGEIAAIVLHELGHNFTYYEMVGQLFTTNFAVDAATREFMGAKEHTTKVKIVKDYAKSRNVKIEDVEALAMETKEDKFITVLLGLEIEQGRSTTGGSMYDVNSVEYLSDQWATRHCAGADLVTGLDKLLRGMLHPASWNPGVFLALELYKTFRELSGWYAAATIATGGQAVIFILIKLVMVALVGNTNQDVYDFPKDRLQRIKNDMVNTIKHEELTESQRKTFIDDIAVIDKSIENFHDLPTAYQILWRVISPTTRRELGQKKLQQGIERLQANDLFVAAKTF